MQFLSDFRILNQLICKKPLPITNIKYMLLKLERFMHASSLDLKIGYDHIKLSPRSKQRCTIVLPWGNHEYQNLPMVIKITDVFQEIIYELFKGFDAAYVYIDNALVITKKYFTNHLKEF